MKKSGNHEIPGGLAELNNQTAGRTNAHVPVKKRKVGGNMTKGGGINRPTRGK